jgi:hypothetical protein
MGVDVMRLATNVEPRYIVTMMTREEWTIGPVTPTAVKGLIWYTDGSRTRGWGLGYGDWGRSLWAIFGKKPQYLYKKIGYCFPEHTYPILACAYGIHMDVTTREIGYYLLWE